MSQGNVAANEGVNTDQKAAPGQVRYKNLVVNGLNIAYREAGNPAHRKLVLLHGFPASSHQYRDLIGSDVG